jgi:RimJ/RimL family protein N-acetyltransferase
MILFETERLVLRRLHLGDAEFILRLLNEPSWLQYIGDRNVHSIEDAQKYLTDSTLAMYERYGFGLFLAETIDKQEPIGLCGLIKRESLEDVDLGFAFLPAFWGKGYALEAAAATVTYGMATHHLSRILAITLENNAPCIRLLKKLGFGFEKSILLAEGSEALQLYSMNA